MDVGEKYKIPRSETNELSLFIATEIIRFITFLCWLSEPQFFFLSNTDTKKIGTGVPYFTV